MNVFHNDSKNMVSEMIEGLVNAFPSHYERLKDKNCVLYTQRRRDKVALVTGGGAGHEPLFFGFVGKGLADAAICGNLYNAPDPLSIYETAKAVSTDKGVIFLYGTYPGDIMNFDIAEERLNNEGIITRHIRVSDDVASAPATRKKERRGIAGDIFLFRIVGAACDSGLDINEIVRLADIANNNIWSIGVALPSNSGIGGGQYKDNDEAYHIEYGIGLHGERGILKTDMQPVDQLVNRMYSQCIDEADLERDNEVCVLVNGLGTISLMSQLIAFRRLRELIESDGLRLYDADANNYCSSYSSTGFSITVMKINEELKKYYQADCYSPFYSHRVSQRTENSISQLTNDRAKKRPILARVSPRENTSFEEHTRKRLPSKLLEVLDVRDMMIYTADNLIKMEDELNVIDQQAGDGDHGICIANGMRKAQNYLKNIRSSNSIADVFQAMGKAMLITAGGASGVFFGNMFTAAADTVRGKNELTVKNFAEMWSSALLATEKKGGARVGDKTLIDALYPAIVALEEHCEDDFIIALSAAETGAKCGMENTVNMRAKFGRGKFLPERTIGVQDAGATTIWLMFKGMRDYFTTNILSDFSVKGETIATRNAEFTSYFK